MRSSLGSSSIRRLSWLITLLGLTGMLLGVVGVGVGPASAGNPATITVKQDCDSVDVNSDKDLSNIIVQYSDGTYQKFDSLSGTSWTLDVPTEHGHVVAIWIHAGNNWEGGDGDDEPLPAEYNSGKSVGEYFSLTVPGCADKVEPAQPSFTPGDCSTPAKLSYHDTDDYTWSVTGGPEAVVLEAVPTDGSVELVGQTVFGPYDTTQPTGEACESDAPVVTGSIVCADTPDGFVYTLSYTVVQDDHGYLDDSSFVPSPGVVADYDHQVIEATVEWTGVDDGPYPATLDIEIPAVQECPLDDVPPPSGTAAYDCSGELVVSLAGATDYTVSKDGTQVRVPWVDEYGRLQLVVIDITPAPSEEECNPTKVLPETVTPTPTPTPVQVLAFTGSQNRRLVLGGLGMLLLGMGLTIAARRREGDALGDFTV